MRLTFQGGLSVCRCNVEITAERDHWGVVSDVKKITGKSQMLQLTPPTPSKDQEMRAAILHFAEQLCVMSKITREGQILAWGCWNVELRAAILCFAAAILGFARQAEIPYEQQHHGEVGAPVTFPVQPAAKCSGSLTRCWERAKENYMFIFF